MFVPKRGRFKEENGKLIGQNIFMKAVIKADNGRDIPIMTMGPICIAPKLKRKGYGKILLDYSLEKAAKMGCGAEPKDYEIQKFVARHYYHLKFSPSVDVKVKQDAINPKRRQREEWGKDAVEMNPGDCINIPVGVKHWHGAAPDSWFSHLAIEVPGKDGSNEWLEAVDDKQYGKLD